MNHKSSPKSINALMKYLRTCKNIDISGASDKQKLMKIGYYHGYKGYRYISNLSQPQQRKYMINYTNFEALMAVYDFDVKLKALLYPWVMQIETAFKNYVLEAIIQEANSANFLDIYSKLLNNYKMFSIVGKQFNNAQKKQEAEEKFKRELGRRLELRNLIYKTHTDSYKKGNRIAYHFLSRDVNLPIWATFELLSLGEFGHFVSCLNKACRTKISQKLKIAQGDDTNAMMPQRLIYAIKDLRNAIAHNDVIFDARFRKSNIAGQISNAITNATGVHPLTFDTITDYLVLIIYQLKLTCATKTEMKRIITSYTDSVNKLYYNIPINIFHRIIYTDNKQKIETLKKYVSR